MQLDQPLSEKEFDELDSFLLSERSPEDAMTMDMLHGYLTAFRLPADTDPQRLRRGLWEDHRAALRAFVQRLSSGR